MSNSRQSELKKQLEEEKPSNDQEVKQKDDQNKNAVIPTSDDLLDDAEPTTKDKMVAKLSTMLDKASNAVSGKTVYEEETEVSNAVRKPVRFGVWTIIIFLGIGLLWSVTAPIDSAAIAQGKVVLDKNKRTVQHLEGGIISEILIKEGDKVVEGQTLMRLDSTNAIARKGIIDVQVAANTALESRLIALRDNKEEVTFPDWLEEEAKKSVEIKELLEAEVSLFETKKKGLAGHIDILNQKIAQLNNQITGLQSQEKASYDQIDFLKQRIDAVQKLVDKGQATRPRLLELKGRLSDIQGREGEYKSMIAKAQQAIIEAKLEIINVRNETLSEVISQLREAQNNLSDLEEKRRAVVDVVDRLEIKAQQSGVITNMKYFTVGGVISPATPILEIVPQDDELVIEAYIKPQDIDVVRNGLQARVRLTAFKVRKIPLIEGTVIHVSPDSFENEASGSVFYKARVLLDAEQINNLEEAIELYPGMPADVLIVTGQRTFMQYLISPITDTFSKAFREQ